MGFRSRSKRKCYTRCLCTSCICSNRVIEWDSSPDPKESVIQDAFVLHAFVGANAMSIYEVITTLDIAWAKIVYLEKKLNTQ
jgi:hypothetical protein